MASHIPDLQGLTLEQLRDAIVAETDRIWSTEPDEIRAMRLGVYPSECGSYGQYFSNMVFINGDMRALSTWITPKVVLQSLAHDDFTLEQCQSIFSWINMVNSDFLAYANMVTFARFIRAIVDSYPQMKTKEDMFGLVEAWYGYANRLYFWVHSAFPWGVGLAFPRLTRDDADFIAKAMDDTTVTDYFDEVIPLLRAEASE